MQRPKSRPSFVALRSDIDIRVFAISAVIDLDLASCTLCATEILGEFARCLEIRMPEANMRDLYQLHFDGIVRDGRNKHIRHDALSYEFGQVRDKAEHE